MAKLLVESALEVESLMESSDNGKKNYYIEGIFMQSSIKNKNGRIYPLQILESATNKYIHERVATNRAIGSLNHPANQPYPDPREASHLITELKIVGNDVHGKARILDTHLGKTVKALIEGGYRFGVSSRALGSLDVKKDASYVKEDLCITAVDIVDDPSAYNAFVDPLMESMEFEQLSEGVWRPIDQFRDTIKKASKSELQEGSLQLEAFKKLLGICKNVL